jgi:cob(I)alamin adenosyltransferase
MGIFNQIAEYLYLKKRDPDAPRTQWMKYMHGINRLSLLLFLLAMIILAVKLLWKRF